MKYFLLVCTALMMLRCSGKDAADISASGTIEGTDINIGTEVPGKVQKVLVDEGSRVRSGDTLVIIDDVEFQIQLRQADANLKSVESAYRLAVEGSRKEDIIQAEAAFK